MDGWLQKRGPTRSYAWQQRWCVVQPGTSSLAFYQDRECKERRGDIHLRGLVRAVPFREPCAPGDALQHRAEHPHGFVLEVQAEHPHRSGGHRPKRRFYFDAGSGEQLARWTWYLPHAAAAPAAVGPSVGPAGPPRDEPGVRGTSSSESEPELGVAPHAVRVSRRYAYSAEAYGVWNEMRAAFRPPRFEKSDEHRAGIMAALRQCPFFSHARLGAIEDLADAMPVAGLSAGSCIMRQGEAGGEAYVILSGVADVYNENAAPGSPRARIVPKGQGQNGGPPGDSDSDPPRGEFVRTMATGRLFGEMAMLFGVAPRTRSVYARSEVVLGKLEREAYQQLVIRQGINVRHKREACLRKVPMLETLDDEQIAHIADVLDELHYEKDTAIIRQGDVGKEFFVLLDGECVATQATGNEGTTDIIELKRYYPGDMFGELALLYKTRRKATITASTGCQVLCLRRRAFERMLGALDLLQKQKYLNDPRKSIADFYCVGDTRGPGGAIAPPPSDREEERTDWFAVYRPTSRDAIAKMLNGIAVGKGINVKGKSAKPGTRLSGFVPFMQISRNDHKHDLEESPSTAWVKMFYTSQSARVAAIKVLEPLLAKFNYDEGIELIDAYKTVYGIRVPEVVMREAYIMRPDISFLLGWETGRPSEPAIMDYQLQAVRGKSSPEVVLYQIDESHPLNPHGLLMAYAEATVKPVVSDFDTFTVGSRRMLYTDTPLPPDQVNLALWVLQHTREVLDKPNALSWNSRWIDVLKTANKQGFHPEPPEFGFGDATSYSLITAVIRATSDSGAVRHGAECFNYYFPQELQLDDEYLIVWEGFIGETGKPWNYLKEPAMRAFLLDRVADGFDFPLNPVWPTRDPGWFEVWDALLQTEHGIMNARAWYPPESGITEEVAAIHGEYPEGFQRDLGRGDSKADPRDHWLSKTLDLDAIEKADLTLHVVQASRHGSTKWDKVAARAIRNSLYKRKSGTRVLDTE